MATEIAFGEIVFVVEGAGQNAPAEGGVGDDGDVALEADFGDVVFENRGVPEGELDLDGGDGVDGMTSIIS